MLTVVLVALVVLALLAGIVLFLGKRPEPEVSDRKTLEDAEAAVRSGGVEVPVLAVPEPEPAKAVIDTTTVKPKPVKKAPAKKAAAKKAGRPVKRSATSSAVAQRGLRRTTESQIYAPTSYGYPYGTYWNPAYGLWYFGGEPLDSTRYDACPGPGENGWTESSNGASDYCPPSYDSPSTSDYSSSSDYGSSSSSYDSGSSSSSYDSGSSYSSSYDSGSSSSSYDSGSSSYDSGGSY
jgi:hypothetical protein